MPIAIGKKIVPRNVKRCFALSANERLKGDVLLALGHAGGCFWLVNCDGRVLAHVSAELASGAAGMPQCNGLLFV